jgi:hypothetical protein
MAQPSAAEANGVVTAQPNGEMDHSVFPGKRKRDASEDAEEVDGMDDVKLSEKDDWAPRDQVELIKAYYSVLKRYRVNYSPQGPVAMSHHRVLTPCLDLTPPSCSSSILYKMHHQKTSRSRSARDLLNLPRPPSPTRYHRMLIRISKM